MYVKVAYDNFKINEYMMSTLPSSARTQKSPDKTKCGGQSRRDADYTGMGEGGIAPSAAGVQSVNPEFFL